MLQNEAANEEWNEVSRTIYRKEKKIFSEPTDGLILQTLRKICQKMYT